jgi:hypothetical protein
MALNEGWVKFVTKFWAQKANSGRFNHLLKPF